MRLSLNSEGDATTLSAPHQATGDRVGVVVLLDSLENPGGGERLAIENAARLDPERFSRALCLTRWSDEFETQEPAAGMLARLRSDGVEIIPVRRRGRWSLRAWLPLLRKLRDEDVRVLHGHLFGSNVWAAIFGTLMRTRAVVAHEHMWAYENGGARPLVDRFVIGRLVDAFVAVSGEGMRQMLEIEKVPEGKVVLVPNGVPPRPGGSGARARAAFEIEEGIPLVVSVGHLRPEKAFEVLVEAASLLPERHRGTRFLIAGEGGERAKLEDLRGRLDVSESVLIPGARSDVADILAAADVAVCCSDFEGGPLSVMEYMEAGLPVVATEVGGLPELVREDETGLLVPPRDPAALAAGLTRLLDDPSLRRRLGEEGRRLQAELYGIDAWIRRLEALYSSLLGDGDPGSAELSSPAVSDIKSRLKRAAKRSRTMAIGGRIAAERVRDVRRLTGRRDNPMGATHWSLPLQTSLDYIDGVFGDYLLHGGLAIADLEGAKVLELGPGDNFGVALSFLAAGANEVVATDRFVPYRNPENQRRIYAALAERLDGPGSARVAEALSGPEPDLEAAGLRQLEETPIEVAAEVLGGGFDLVVSRAVLEHVGDLEAAFTAMDRLLAPGGRMIHKVDLEDHGLFSEGGLNPLTFLTVSDRTYRWMGESSAGLPNRVLVGWYRDEMLRRGYDASFLVTNTIGSDGELDRFVPLEGLEPDRASLALVESIRDRLLPRYRGLEASELAISGFMLVADKPAG
ncbi:MAG: glycosyltransferase [Solirubrobacterales bacterium]|nr:glycosyltransferase [Solirubrobacterales bacterium]